MPKIAVSVGELYKAIERPVAMSVAKSLLKLTALNHEKVVISFPGKAESQPLYNSREWQNEGEDNAHFTAFSKFAIEVSEEYDEASMMNMYLHDNDSPLYFQDPDLDITIRPVYTDKRVTLSINYRASTLREAETFRDHLRMRIAQESQEFLFDVTFDVVLPDELGATLQILHATRETKYGYGEELHEYLTDRLSTKQIRLADQAGNNVILAFRERQTGIIGHFEFAEPVKESKNTETSYLMSMDFVFTYSKPILLSMVYPIIIHNQLIPSSVFSKDVLRDWSRLAGDKTDIGHHLEFFRQLSGFLPPSEGLNIPYYDEWLPDITPDAHRCLMQVLCVVDDAQPNALLNLGSLGKIKLTDPVLTYFKENYTFLKVVGALPFSICVYENSNMLHEELIVVDADLNVSLTRPLNPRKQYHVVLNVLTDPTRLSGSATAKLLWEPQVAADWLFSLTALEPIELETIAGGRKITDFSFKTAIAKIAGTPNHYRWTDVRVWALINRFTVKTGVK